LFQGIPHPQDAETCGLKEAIICLGNRGSAMVSIELDCKQADDDDIFNKIGTNSKLRAILNDCKSSLSSLPNFKIVLLYNQTMWPIY
jgi:hypothetical protein